MAIEFGGNVTEVSEVPNYVTPKQGVQEDVSYLNSLSGMFGAAETFLMDRNEDGKSKALAAFTEQQLILADAVEQGIRTPEFASSAMRKNLLAAVQANPTLTKDLIGVHGSLLGIEGGANVVRTEIERKNSQFNQLMNDGLINRNASEVEVEEAWTERRLAINSKNEFDEMKRTIDLKKSTLDLNSAEYKAQEAKLTRAAQKTVRDMATTEFNNFKTNMDAIVNSDAPESEKTKALNDLWATWNNQQTELFSYLPDNEIAGLKMPFELAFNDYQKRAIGEYGDADLRNAIDRKKLVMEYNLALDPAVLSSIVVSSLYKGTALDVALTNGTVYTAAMQSISRLVDNETPFSPFSPKATVNKANKVVFEKVYSGVTSSEVEASKEAVDALNKMLEGVYVGEGEIRYNPKSARAISESMASQEFYRAMQDERVDPGKVEDAREVLHRHYHQEVWKMVGNEFTNNKVGYRRRDNPDPLTGEFDEAVATTDLVVAESTPSGVRFRAIDSEDALAIKEARRLNKELAPVINTTLKAASHLEGHKNYGDMWDRVGQEMLFATGDDQIQGGEADDDLTLGDFTSNLGAVERLSDADIRTDLVGKIAGTGFQHGQTMDQVEGMIIHHTGGRGTVGSVVKTLKDRGLSVQFVIDRQGEVHQLMEENAVAWHAGKNNKSSYNNQNTLGVEIIGNDDKDILPIQIEAAKRLIKTISDKHGFDPTTNVFGHGEVATHKRKTEGMSTITTIRG